MLTRLEVDGFKNLLGLSVDFAPFTCIAGENAAGKSNLFDAIEFLAYLADRPLMEAAQHVRGSSGQRAGDPRELFWDGYRTSSPSMTLKAEMIVPREIEDDFGQPAKATITFLQYELRIGYEGPSGSRRVGRLVLLAEKLSHINLGDAPHRLRFPHSVKEWRSQLLRGRRSAQFISTESHNGDTLVKVHQDGGSRGQPKVAAAARSPATVVSTTTQANDPTILAVRREMQGWKRLALEPSAMRAGDSFNDPQEMETNGRHLAGTLYRVALTAEADSPDDVYARVASRLGSLTGVHVDGLSVLADEAREILTLLMTEQTGVELPAKSLSEGTLRFLALCVLLEDTSVTGVLCMEEPENGIHPANIPAMVDIVRDLAVDATTAPGEDNPLRQVIVNTHSPYVVQLVDPSELLFADVRPISDEPHKARQALRLRPMIGTWRAANSQYTPVGKADLVHYLTAPAGAQLVLEPTGGEVPGP